MSVWMKGKGNTKMLECDYNFYGVGLVKCKGEPGAERVAADSLLNPLPPYEKLSRKRRKTSSGALLETASVPVLMSPERFKDGKTPYYLLDDTTYILRIKTKKAGKSAVFVTVPEGFSEGRLVCRTLERKEKEMLYKNVLGLTESEGDRLILERLEKVNPTE